MIEITVGQIVGVVSFEVKEISLDTKFKEVGLDHLDLRDILYYLEQELDLVMDDLWHEEDLVSHYPTLRFLLTKADTDKYTILGL